MNKKYAFFELTEEGKNYLYSDFEITDDDKDPRNEELKNLIDEFLDDSDYQLYLMKELVQSMDEELRRRENEK